MRILQLISSGGYFGAENVLIQLACELAKEKTNEIVTGVLKNIHNPHTEVAEVSQKRGVESIIFPCKGKFDARTIFQMRRFIQSRKIDLIHSHGYKSNLYAYFSCLGLPIAHVATCHNWLGDDAKMKFYATLDRFFLKRFDKIVAVSPEVQRKITESGTPLNKTAIIQNGIALQDLLNSAKDLREEFGIPSDNIIVGTVGRISKEKGHEYLLQATMDILEEFPKTTLLVVGDGILRENLQSAFKHPSIIFTGLRSDITAIYKCMDIFVLPSLTEGLPMVLLEAMSAALPVIATTVGSVPEVIREGETGLLVATGDKQALYMALRQLLQTPWEIKRMGENGRKRVIAHYSSKAMADKYKKIYIEATGWY